MHAEGQAEHATAEAKGWVEGATGTCYVFFGLLAQYCTANSLQGSFCGAETALFTMAIWLILPMLAGRMTLSMIDIFKKFFCLQTLSWATSRTLPARPWETRSWKPRAMLRPQVSSITICSSCMHQVHGCVASCSRCECQQVAQQCVHKGSLHVLCHPQASRTKLRLPKHQPNCLFLPRR